MGNQNLRGTTTYNCFLRAFLYFLSLCLSVAINLIVQHIQDILNGDICKWQRGTANGHPLERTLKRGMDEARENMDGGGSNIAKRPLLEPSTRPH